MLDIFYEETTTIQNEKGASIKFGIFNFLSAISYVLAVVWAFLVFFGVEFGKGNLLVNILFSIIPILLFIFSGIMLGKVRNKFYVEYDYTFISGEVRVSKVIKQKKRVNVLTFETKHIEKIGKYGSKTYERYVNMPETTQTIFTSNNTACEGKDLFYIVLNTSNGKNLMIFECTEIFIAHVLKFSNKTVLEEDYKWYILTTQPQQNQLKVR